MTTSLPTAGTVVAETLEKWPQTAHVFQKYHMACIGCAIAPFVTLTEVAKIYHLNLSQLLADLQEAASGEYTKEKRNTL